MLLIAEFVAYFLKKCPSVKPPNNAPQAQNSAIFRAATNPHDKKSLKNQVVTAFGSPYRPANKGRQPYMPLKRNLSAQTEAAACGTALKNAFAANGLPISLYERCQLNTFASLVATKCNNHTNIPPELKAWVESACAPGQCNRAGDCTDVTMAAISILAGPNADQTTYSICGLFFVLMSWPQYGVQGCIDRVNCFWDFPPELQLRIPPPVSTRSALSRVAIYLVVLAAAVTGVAITVATLWLWRRRRYARESLRNQEALKARLSKSAENMELLRWYSFPELQKATQNFAPQALLGRGGSGKVFVGTLADGTKIAVKQLQESASAAGVEVWSLTHVPGRADRLQGRPIVWTVVVRPRGRSESLEGRNKPFPFSEIPSCGKASSSCNRLQVSNRPRTFVYSCLVSRKLIE
jgi:hypothetical protein